MPAPALRTPTDIGAFIKARRRTLGLDQAELALRIGVSRLWVNQIEHGKAGASLGLVLRALAALGVTLVGTIEGEAETSRKRKPAPVVTPDINAIIAKARRR